MKTKVFGLLICALSFGVLFSCSSDDDAPDNSPSTSGEIYGKWFLDEFKLSGSFTEIDEGETFEIEFSGVAQEVPDGNYINFNNDGTFTSAGTQMPMEITYVLNGQPLPPQVIMISEVFEGDGSWAKDGDLLFIDDQGLDGGVNYHIVELNTSILKLYSDETDLDIGSELPQDAEIEVEITLKR